MNLLTKKMIGTHFDLLRHEQQPYQNSRITAWDPVRSLERPREPRVIGLKWVGFEPIYFSIGILKRWTTGTLECHCLMRSPQGSRDRQGPQGPPGIPMDRGHEIR